MLLPDGSVEKRNEVSLSTNNFLNIKITRADQGEAPGVALLTIDRPDVLNALNTETLKEMRRALEELSTDTSVRVVVLTGSGEKAFIAGADISEMHQKNTSLGISFAQMGQEVTKLLEFMPKPTIAAVNGFALGGGTEMAISCDFIVCSENAVFGQPEVALGIIPGFGGTARLAKFVGFPRAKELIFSGRKIKADEALRIGLTNRVVPLSELRKTVIDLAGLISRNSFSAVSTAKVLLNEFSESIGLSAKLDAEATEFGKLFASHDQREGMGAFLEKRKPKFLGL